MRKLKILVACECSGAVRREFRKLGHDAWSCDLKPSEDDSKHHIKDDVRAHLSARWDMLIAFPDCTYLCGAAAWAFKDGPYHQKVKPGTLVGSARRVARDQAIEFFRLLWNAPIARIAIENPVGFMSLHIPPTQTIQPYQFGEDASKATCLWLRNLQKLKPGRSINPRMVCKTCSHVQWTDIKASVCPKCAAVKPWGLPRWSNQTDSGQNRLSPGESRATDRARTYPGIAKAMADQWLAL